MAMQEASSEELVGWRRQLRKVVGMGMDDGRVALADVARELAMSRRTLQRRLHEEGTTWRIEVERARRARAAELSALDGITNDRIARCLGYADVRSLRRARRRWKGA